MRAPAKSRSFGGWRPSRNDARWELVVTFWSTRSDVVTSGTGCTVVSGTRATSCRLSASVLASSVRLELACCGETTLVFVSDARSTPDVSPVGAPALSTRSTADEVPPPAWPWLPRLLLCRRGRGRGELECCTSTTRGRRRRFRRRRAGCRSPLSLSHGGGKEYHVIAAVEGHELKTPKTEHCPGLERLLETAHLELDGKLFVNTQQAPTWRANCRCFEPGGSLDRRVNYRRVPQPRWVGMRGEIPRPSCLSSAQVGCTCSRGLQASTREGASGLTRAPSRPSPRGQPS